MISLALVIAVLAIGVAVFTYLQIAFGQSSGFTGPPSSPPTGTGLLTASPDGTMLGINAPTPSTTLTVGGILSVAGNVISDVATPAAGTDAANRDYVDAQSAAGGGSVALYYKTDSQNPQPDPQCPADWSEVYRGYGPHYIGVIAYDWLLNGTGGSGGGFDNFGTQPPTGDPNFRYVLNAVAFGSDSVCSQEQTSVIPVSSLYLNALQYNFTGMNADACYVDSATGQTVCNRCVVCQK